MKNYVIVAIIIILIIVAVVWFKSQAPETTIPMEGEEVTTPIEGAGDELVAPVAPQEGEVAPVESTEVAE